MKLELKDKIELLTEQREMILHNMLCYQGKIEYLNEYHREQRRLNLINSIMQDVINSYPDVEE